jgi:DNA-directed RNA polymerase subunit RPC12/RpoP
MQTEAANSTPPRGEQDLYFKCANCATPLVVDRAAAGMTLACQNCGKPALVPPASIDESGPPSPTVAPPEKLAELQRRLKENESQRTEVNGYINQLSIQLHRWQLRLQTLNERNKDLTAEIARHDNSESPLSIPG